MRCLNPYTNGRAAFPCGDCIPCRFNRRRTWTHRIMLEALCHPSSVFVTLTYNESSLPGSKYGLIPSLEPRHVQLFIKRLRKLIEPQRLRYFAVGEYGDQTSRPHYHLAVFNYPMCGGHPVSKEGCQCSSCSGVRKAWSLGHVSVGTLEANSAQYLCGYVTKKMTHSSDVRLKGRHPEFARMSLRPGIGAHAMGSLVNALRQYQKENTLPSQLRQGKSLMPLGRYLKSKVSEGLGQSEEVKERLTDEALSAAYEELQAVRQVAWVTEKSVREVFREINEPHSRALEARIKLKERSL